MSYGDPATRRWTYTHRAGPREYLHEVTLDAEGLTATRPERGQSPERESLVTAFEQSARLLVSDPAARVEVLRAIAERLAPEQLAREIDRRRLAFWQGYRRPNGPPERFAYVRQRDDGRVSNACSWRLDADGVHARDREDREEEFHGADVCFLSGPPTCWAPLWHRESLRSRLAMRLSAEAKERAGEGFQSLVYDAVERRDWAWDKRDDGESFAGAFAGELMIGYQYGHDYGYGSFVPERVLAEDFWTRVSTHLPSDVRAEVRAHLQRAGVERPGPMPTPEACAKAYPGICERAALDARWPFACELEFDGLEAQYQERQWQGTAALGLFASLAPTSPLPWAALSVADKRGAALYGFSQDSLWLSGDDAGVLLARISLGNAGGVDECWHVLPSRDRCVIVRVGTDYTPATLPARLGAKSEAGLSALRAHVVAYFEAMGLKARES